MSRATPRRWLPSPCPLCGQWSRGSLCLPCQSRFAPRRIECSGCACSLPDTVAGAAPLCCRRCLVDPPPLDSASAALDYGFPWSGLITQWKFGHRLDLGRTLAERMLSLTALTEPGAAAHFDLLIPVPLADGRLRERGFNQSWELARWLARWLAIPGDARLLRRCRDTPAQSLLGAADRARNLNGAFGVPCQLQPGMAGRRIALIDDVMTTGATAFEAARTLRHAGAAEVHLWVLARTPEPGAASGCGDNHDPCSESSWSSPRSRPTPET